jgi:uncharacterized lipoprotein YddW (UPF0748 family)
MRAAGLDTAMVLVADGRRALYGSRYLPVDSEVLEQLLPLAAREGMELHAWIVALRCNLPSIVAEHADWYSVSRNGDSSRDQPPYIPSYQWLCPTRRDVRGFLCSIVDELAQYDGLMGIHLDYIRHPDVILPVGLRPKYGLVQDRELPEYDFCYCPVCRQAFSQQTGRDPLELDDPASDEEWVRFRWRSVRETVAATAATARARGKHITAAVFATPSLARQYVRQEWDQWDLDAVLPMIYHYYYDQPPSWVPEAVREGVAALPDRVSLHAGLFIPRLEPDELPRVIEGSLDSGADGVALFSYGAMTPAHFQAAGEVLG